MTTSTVQAAIAAVMADVREVRKSERNTGMNFNFRGIDAVLNAVGPALRTHNVIVLPNVVDYTATPTTTANGKNTMHVIVKVEYTFVGPAGDTLTATVIGEAMDYGDKAVPKAMSVAFRTALLQALALPTDDPDPDAQSYERAPKMTANDLLTAISTADTLERLSVLAREVQNHIGDFTPEEVAEMRATYEARKESLA